MPTPAENSWVFPPGPPGFCSSCPFDSVRRLQPHWPLNSWTVSRLYDLRVLNLSLFISASFPSFRASLVAQRLKCLPPMWETRVRSMGREDPLEKEMVTHSSILAWRIPWTEEPGSPRGRKESDTTEWLHSLTHSLPTFMAHLIYHLFR